MRFLLYAVAVIAAFVVAGLLLDSPPSKADVVGRYSGGSLGVSETLSVHADGSFQHLIVYQDGEAYTNQGVWTMQHRAVLFEDLWVYQSEELSGLLDVPEKNGCFFDRRG